MTQISCITRKLTTTWVTSWMSFFLWFIWPESPTSATIYSFFKCKIFQVPILLDPMFTSWSSWSLSEVAVWMWRQSWNSEEKCDTIEDHLTTWLLNKITVEVFATGLWLLQTRSFNLACSSRHWLPPVKLHKTNLEVVGYYMTTMLLFQQWTHLVQYVRNVESTDE